MLCHRSSAALGRSGVAASSSSRAPLSAAATPSSRRQQQRRLVARAAEEEEQQPAAAAEVESEAVPEQAIAADEFDFSYSDAKKGNQWQPSDVEAALAYYADERFLSGSTELPYEAEFVTNPLSAYTGGPEDSSWLADVDNNEAYERDEYSLAGIPEAAPKMKRREEEEDEANSEELRQLEEEKIGAAAFDDIEGLEDDGDDPSSAVWNWAVDGEEGGDGDAAPAAAASSSSEATPLSILGGVSDADLLAHTELSPEQQDVFSVLLDPFASDDAIDLVGQELPEADASLFTTPGLTQEEEAAIAAVLAEQGEADADAALSEAQALTDTYGTKLAAVAAEADLAGDEEPLNEGAVQEYLAALRALGAAESSGIDAATLSQLLGSEPTEEAGELGVGLDPELPKLPEGLAALLSAQDPVLERLAGGGVSAEEAEAGEALGLMVDIEALAEEVDAFNEAVMPAAEDLQDIGAFVDGVLEYYASGGDGLEGALAERPQDAPVNPYDDIDPALLGADAFGADEEESYADRYGTQFAERILELGRVTKVVKGGKLMGFRCVAVVGDGKGRVGVGCQAGREVSVAVKRALVDAKKNIVEVPLVGAGTIPHRSEAWFKAAGVVLQPAADGTGVIAGGAVRAVLELAGVQNVLGKRLGSRSTLNNARVTLKALSQLRTLGDYAEARGVPLDYLRG